MSSPARRLAAIGALLCAAAALVVAVVVLWNNWLPLLGAVALLAVALIAAWYVVTRRGLRRGAAAVISLGALATAFATLLGNHSLFGLALMAGLVVAFGWLAREALRADPGPIAGVNRGDDAGRRSVGSAQRPILIMNPRSGGGKADAAFAAAAHARGIETITLRPGDDLEQLAHEAVARGADVIGMAGGDGSQALVAGIASEHGLPFVCIPAGTRNHFALDLGIDRDDVIGALDAFVEAFERTVDLARVNGRVFVNNVSFGVYAAIVQSDDYRDAKLNTAAKMLPELLGPDFDPFDFAIDGPDAIADCDPDLILVSNNVYKLEGIGGLGTRARLDEGVLGITVVEVHNGAELAQLISLSTAGRGSAYAGWHEWVTTSLDVRSTQPIDAGIDGEAVTLESPVHLEVQPAALRVRIPRAHPGVSPAHAAAAVQADAPRRLLRLAFGRASTGVHPENHPDNDRGDASGRRPAG